MSVVTSDMTFSQTESHVPGSRVWTHRVALHHHHGVILQDLGLRHSDKNLETNMMSKLFNYCRVANSILM